MKYEITKGSEKDFEGSPEWATKVLRDNNDSKKSFVGELAGITLVAEKINPHSWWKYNDGYVGEIIAERRPITEPVWDGEGLPPVGALCRCHGFSDMPWVECEVLAWHDDEVWLKRVDDGKTFTMGNPELFPIRSPEDVARDEAIKDIANVINPSSQSARDILAPAIYDSIAAGKIRGVKLEGK